MEGKVFSLFLSIVVALSFIVSHSEAAVITFQGQAGVNTLAIAWKNGALLNATLAALRPGDELVFPAGSTFYLMGGIIASGLKNNVVRIEGTIVFVGDLTSWPRDANGRVLECLHFRDISNVTFTSSTINSSGGIIDGQGEYWWGLLSYLEIGENRPRLFSIGNSRDILVENLFFRNSPYWTVWIYDVNGLEIRYSTIINRRNDYDGHDVYNLSAFNTDGFDVTGKNVWIHDCTVWNQDDCIAVKDGSENMLFERIHASGLGLAIGSIGGSVVRNITFRDCYMHHTFKGIYMKFRGPGLVENVLYENIFMQEPEQWAIWIGPAQQADSSWVCAAHPCSLCWPDFPFAECNMPANATYADITLRNITVVSASNQSPGVIFGSDTNPIQNIVFDGVTVTNSLVNYYLCQNVASGYAKGDTIPLPSCFKQTS